METDEIENLALLLKGNEKEISEGVKKVCLTAHVLDKVNSLVNSQIKQMMINNPTCIDVSDQNTTEATKKNVQIIFKMMRNIAQLKLISDIVPVDNPVDISEFRNLRTLEIQKIDVSKIVGLNAQRLHLQELIYTRDLDSLKGLLEYCGGDFCSKYIWTELKHLVLPYNKLSTLDDSLECVPWLSSLDLSHNELSSVDEISCLNNLKYLNLSFNKLQRIPKFSGQICNRLQILNVSNNFLEEITQLKSLVNVCELDLSDNCLIDHTVLASLSHLEALHWLSLIGNPLSYHRKHIQNTCTYLHQNIEPQRFILDCKPLSSSDVKLIGTYHPLMQRSNSDSLNGSEGSTKLLTSIDRSKKVREVDIEDTKSVDKEPVPLPHSYSSVDHLEVRNHIHNLRETYGESWLNFYKGPVEKDNSINNSQDISGFTVLDETNSGEDKEPDIQNGEETENNIYSSNVDEISEDEDIEVNSEESIYMAKIPGEEEDLFVVFTKDLLTEIDCTTSKERASWVLSTIRSCEFLDEDHCTVQITFDTLRKDRKSRVYVLQNEDAERLNNCIAQLIDSRVKPTTNKVLQCMKCLKQIPKVDDLLSSHKEEITQCPGCGSTILVEEDVNTGD